MDTICYIGDGFSVYNLYRRNYDEWIFVKEKFLSSVLASQGSAFKEIQVKKKVSHQLDDLAKLDN